LREYDSYLISRRIFLLTPLAVLAAEPKLNVVLIVARGWRGLATPWTGDPDLKAPNLERFGKTAVVFPRAYACDPASDPGRAGILTGRYPHATGVTRDGAPLRTEEVTLDAVLKVAGYAVGDRLEWLETNHAAPFFLNLSLDPPRFSEPLDPSKLHPRENIPAGSDAGVRQELAQRYGMYAALDDQLGKVLDELDRRKLAQDTIVVFTADHGEQIGSHSLEGDGVWFEESVRVPLAIRHPRAQPSASDVLASQVDIVPTLLTLCAEPSFEGLEGHDLSALLLGQKADRPESVFAEGKLGEKDEWRMLVLASDKIVVDVNGTVTHLYNLADDPYELTNLAHEPSVQLKRDQLLAILRATRQKLLDFRRRS
jgi:arylsulfatase A-like enzyme